ncbi:hypothetical protein DFQ28_010366 [Apophysomyces sp. BC1034]|nr:hypothetical protein DFQ29_009083 [Apophysomyces sp. BC1021]KAG0184832.1 hypothetical protein DFQ28_010366 [Apophysomyces sp. BC1034]
MGHEPFDSIKHTHPLSPPPGIDQPQSLRHSTITTRTNEDIGGGEEDGAWKVVGSPSRRESVSIRTNDNHAEKLSPGASPLLHPADLNARLSFAASDKQWGSFGGLQWGSSSILDDDARITRTTLPPSEAKDGHNGPTFMHSPYESVLSVPMVPNVPLKPTYRQHRSLSFSMGQDPALFGYGDSDDGQYRSLLATMEEEQEDDMDLNVFARQTMGGFHARSQSSGAIFGLLPASQNIYYSQLLRRRGSEQQQTDHCRRSSFDAWNGSEASQTTSYLPPLMDENDWCDMAQRRWSLNHTDYIPPGQANYDPAQQRCPITTKPPQQQIQEVVEQLDTTHLFHDTPSASTTFSSAMSNTLSAPLQVSFPPSTDILTPTLSLPAASGSSSYSQQSLLTIEPVPRSQQEIGKGVALNQLHAQCLLYKVEFKAGRTDYFYVPRTSNQICPLVGDLVIVEADRGKDLGNVSIEALTIDQVATSLKEEQENGGDKTTMAPEGKSRSIMDIHVKQIYRLAAPGEIGMMLIKAQDEQRALVVCQQKVKQRKLPMDVVDAEYQW